MQTHIYRCSGGRVIRQSFFIWLFIVLQLFINVYVGPTFLDRGDGWLLVFINLLFGGINVAGVALFVKYFRNSWNKEFIVRYDTVELRDSSSGDGLELKSSEIVKVKLVQNTSMSRLPWLFHEYLKLIDEHGKEIVVTSYIMDISEFWTDSLALRISSKKFERVTWCYSVFRKAPLKAAIAKAAEMLDNSASTMEPEAVCTCIM